MASTTPQQTGTTNGIQETKSADSIDQVRDLLFGAQMRAVDERLAKMDASNAAEAAAIRTEMREAVSALDARISNELSRLTSQLQSDKLDRSALAAGLTDLANRITGDRAGAGKQTTNTNS